MSDIFSPQPEQEIVSSRTFNNPIEQVFEAWSNPEHLKNWWGPNGFTNTFHEFDFRVGGKWVFTMHGPEKGTYQNECEFLAIDAPRFIAWKRHSQPFFNIAVHFDDPATNQTKLVFRMIFPTPEACNKLKPYVIDKNEENFDHLETELSKMRL